MVYFIREVKKVFNSKILIVDDEIQILKLISMLFKKEGFNKVDFAQTGADAINYITKNNYDLVLLDVMLPDTSGLEICRGVRQNSDVPILFLTARNSDIDKVSGFAYGGDDYITKPFNPLELIARVKAHLRRNINYKKEYEPSRSIFDNGRIKIDYDAAVVEVDNENISLSAQLFQLLKFLSTHPNRVFTKEQLFENLWDSPLYGYDNTVTVHIRRLREKIEKDPSNPELIVNVRGLGYKFVGGSL